nr:hypothetical protein [Tanacetum cinerariifolium]
MRTRSGSSYSYLVAGAPSAVSWKKRKLTSASRNYFDVLHDDIVLSILVKVSSTAECPADFISALATCKRFNGLGVEPLVLSKASKETFAVTAKKWSPSANRFLLRSSRAGNIEASYILGMIEFYCFQNWGQGASLMARAAVKAHAPALYSLAIIQFNGSGGTKNKKDLIAGVTLCARAAVLGHIDAVRELGHCLKDGYGVTKNIVAGQRFLIEANIRELTANNPKILAAVNLTRLPLLVDNVVYEVPVQMSHPANRFLTGWFTNRVPDPAYNICSYESCGRPETRTHEFRRCSVCGVRTYCSRGCQARDWTMGHFKTCTPLMRFAGQR